MRKKILVFVPVFIVFVLVFTLVTPTVAMSEDISNKVFRLHILANSNSEEDQKLKLKVRNRLLKETESIYSSCNSVEDAIILTEDNLEFIEDTAQKVVAFYGYDYDVSVEVTKSYFNTRKYSNFTLPAGEYNCLRINIGKAKGHNWWCVMYPTVCVSGCTDEFSDILTEDEMKMVTSNGYIIRFKAVEIYENLKSKIIS